MRGAPARPDRAARGRRRGGHGRARGVRAVLPLHARQVGQAAVGGLVEQGVVALEGFLGLVRARARRGSQQGREDVRRGGRLDPVGDTRDLESASFDNGIGAAELTTVWQDPDFDPKQRAFYYVRALEIPTPRWITYDAAFFGVALPEGVEPSHQERAYTSPIWYTPKRG